jgi:hypothetical protein
MFEIAILFLVLVVFYLIVRSKVLTRYVAEEYRYTARKRYFSDVEHALNIALLEAVEDKALVQSKVALSSIVVPQESNAKKRSRAYAKALKATLDYVIVEKQSGQVVCTIVIDDGKKISQHKADREKAILAICRSANIPVISLNQQHAYRVSAISRKLSPYLKLETDTKNAKFCQKCGSPLVIRTATQGEVVGRRFWVCSRAPNCNYIENILEH